MFGVQKQLVKFQGEIIMTRFIRSFLVNHGRWRNLNLKNNKDVCFGKVQSLNQWPTKLLRFSKIISWIVELIWLGLLPGTSAHTEVSSWMDVLMDMVASNGPRVRSTMEIGIMENCMGRAPTFAPGYWSLDELNLFGWLRTPMFFEAEKKTININIYIYMDLNRNLRNVLKKLGSFFEKRSTTPTRRCWIKVGGFTDVFKGFLCWRVYSLEKQHVSGKIVVGRLLSFWNGPFFRRHVSFRGMYGLFRPFFLLHLSSFPVSQFPGWDWIRWIRWGGFKHVESHGIFWRNCLRDHKGQWVTGQQFDIWYFWNFVLGDTNIAPQEWCLEDHPYLLKWSLFRGHVNFILGGMVLFWWTLPLFFFLKLCFATCDWVSDSKLPFLLFAVDFPLVPQKLKTAKIEAIVNEFPFFPRRHQLSCSIMKWLQLWMVETYAKSCECLGLVTHLCQCFAALESIKNLGKSSDLINDPLKEPIKWCLFLWVCFLGLLDSRLVVFLFQI